jgi:hypothetical protein
MKLPFAKKKEEDRTVISNRLGAIKKDTKNEKVTGDVKELVKGIAGGDSG